jgi:hypothetical protein
VVMLRHWIPEGYGDTDVRTWLWGDNDNRRWLWGNSGLQKLVMGMQWTSKGDFGETLDVRKWLW